MVGQGRADRSRACAHDGPGRVETARPGPLRPGRFTLAAAHQARRARSPDSRSEPAHLRAGRPDPARPLLWWTEPLDTIADALDRNKVTRRPRIVLHYGTNASHIRVDRAGSRQSRGRIGDEGSEQLPPRHRCATMLEEGQEREKRPRRERALAAVLGDAPAHRIDLDIPEAVHWPRDPRCAGNRGRLADNRTGFRSLQLHGKPVLGQ